MIELALSLAKFAPDLVGLLKGSSKAQEVAQKAVEIAKAVTGEQDGDSALNAISASPEMALKYKQAILDNKVELDKLALQKEQMYIDDTKDAREKFSQHEHIFWLGVVILFTFAVGMVAVLSASFYLIQGGIKIDGNALAAVMGLVGSVIGYLAANAQQVIGFFFGSSVGSRNNSSALVNAVENIGKTK